MTQRNSGEIKPPSWQKGLDAALVKNASSRSSSQIASLSLANVKVKELTAARQTNYMLSPRLCLFCFEPLTYKRVTKEAAKFCNRSCSASHSNQRRAGESSSKSTGAKVSHSRINQAARPNPMHTVPRYLVATDSTLWWRSESISGSCSEVLDTCFNEISYGQRDAIELWLKLAKLAELNGLTDWSMALAANVRIFKDNSYDDGNAIMELGAMAGYLIYCMTADRAHPYSSALFELIRARNLTSEVNFLLPDWVAADGVCRLYHYAARISGASFT